MIIDLYVIFLVVLSPPTTFADVLTYVFVHIFIGSDVVNTFVLSQPFYNYLALQIKALFTT